RPGDEVGAEGQGAREPAVRDVRQDAACRATAQRAADRRYGHDGGGRARRPHPDPGRLAMGRVVVAGLGPAGPELRPAQTNDAIARAAVVFQRTSRHPSALDGVTSFDDMYERSASMDEVYASIVDALVARAAAGDDVLYLVPGSPLVAERTVELLRA